MNTQQNNQVMQPSLKQSMSTYTEERVIVYRNSAQKSNSVQ